MSGARAEVHAAFRFAVEIQGVTEASFTECTLPTLEVEVEEEKEGGFNDGTHILPSRVTRGTLVLKRGLVSSSALLRWYTDVLQGRLQESRRQVSIILYDSRETQVARWDLSGAYPYRWSGPQLQADSNQVAVETLELYFERVTVT
jgi:phage tail-like protein